jgi:enoyl-CoA hydratase/carnithine racemase
MTVRLEIAERVALVTLDRPDRRNAVDHETLLQLQQVQRRVSEADVRALVLTGTPPAFCAGADLTGVESGEFVATLYAVLHGFTELPFATIAAVDGAALGAGSQLVAACDLRVATAGSVFGIPAAKLGLVVDHWTVERLAREFGWSIARAMLIAAHTYDTAQLAAAGAIHKVGDLAMAMQWAGELTRLAPLTIATHKLALEQSGPPPQLDALVEEARRTTWGSADAEEGRIAFLEKRPARFRGE